MASNVGPTGLVGPSSASAGPLGPVTNQPIRLRATIAAHPDGLDQRVVWQVSKSSDFSTVLFSVAGLMLSTTGERLESLPHTVLDEQRTYYVRARIEDSEGGVGNWSSPVEFYFTRVRVWNGSTWSPKVVRAWDGTSWAIKPMKVRIGTNWR
jgi:hypothetical protein